MNTVKISLNGNIRDVREGTTILNLLKELEVEEFKIIVQVSGEIIASNKYHLKELKNGDIVELINFVGGG